MCTLKTTGQHSELPARSYLRFITSLMNFVYSQEPHSGTFRVTAQQWPCRGVNTELHPKIPICSVLEMPEEPFSATEQHIVLHVCNTPRDFMSGFSLYKWQEGPEDPEVMGGSDTVTEP